MFEKVNNKVVKVNLASGQVLARKGAMLFYNGQVGFVPANAGGMAGAMGAMQGGGGGLGAMMGAASRGMAGENVLMMSAQGQGEVYYGFGGLYVTVVQLQGGTLVAEASSLLAHTANLQSSVVSLASQGGGGGGLRGMIRGAVTGQGMFTTQLSGHGSAVLLSHGGTIELMVRPGGGTVVDPQAYVGHTGNIRLDLSANVGWREAVGRGSGEAIQLKLDGDGVVYVQASEEKL